jgi:mRNA-degrading endonuclease YafQ of YafQ-DinJ toxin-antitoxin module
VRGRPELRERIEQTLRRLADNPFDPGLRTHKLKGPFTGTWSCSMDYDCRVVFEFVPHPELDEQAILLIDIGTHDDVY